MSAPLPSPVSGPNLWLWAAAGVLLAAFVLGTRRDGAIRGRLLNDTTNRFWSSSVSAISLLRLDKSRSDATSEKLKESIEKLHAAAAAKGGRFTYMGRGEVLIRSAQIEAAFAKQGGCGALDLVVISDWPSSEALDAWWEASTEWKLHLVQSYHRNAALNWFAGLVLPAIVRAIALLKRQEVDLAAVSRPLEGELVEPPNDLTFTATRLHRLSQNVDRGRQEGGTAEDGVLMVNWVKDAATPEEKAKDEAYGMQVLTMLAQFGGAPMHIALGPKPAEKEHGAFDQIAAIHYPSRGFVVQLLRSEWFRESLQSKVPTDTICVCTTPFHIGGTATSPPANNKEMV